MQLQRRQTPPGHEAETLSQERANTAPGVTLPARGANSWALPMPCCGANGHPGSRSPRHLS